jgi:hypothetical protein
LVLDNQREVQRHVVHVSSPMMESALTPERSLCNVGVAYRDVVVAQALLQSDRLEKSRQSAKHATWREPDQNEARGLHGE